MCPSVPRMPHVLCMLRILLILAAVGLLAGCDTLAYYTQAVGGQFELIARRRPLEALLEDPATAADLRARLESARAIRIYASQELGLPDNGSYRSYAALDRPYVVWTVFAAQEFSTRALESCFPVTGCVSYRGFFGEADAQHYAAGLRAAGNDVRVSGVPAYSTLGWFDDPLLSSFIRYPEAELARLLFHELAHHVVYVKGDTAFNESFAVAVERAGVHRWLAANKRHADFAVFLAARARQAEFIALIETAKARLEGIYAGSSSLSDIDARRAQKRAGFEALQRDYAAMKLRWGGFAGYDRILGSEPNNALLVSVTAYSKFVPGFERLLFESGGDLARFYAAVKRIAALPARERERCLDISIRSAAC